MKRQWIHASVVVVLLLIHSCCLPKDYHLAVYTWWLCCRAHPHLWVKVWVSPLWPLFLNKMWGAGEGFVWKRVMSSISMVQLVLSSIWIKIQWQLWGFSWGSNEVWLNYRHIALMYSTTRHRATFRVLFLSTTWITKLLALFWSPPTPENIIWLLAECSTVFTSKFPSLSVCL